MGVSAKWLDEFAKNDMHPVGENPTEVRVVNLSVPPSVNNLYFNASHGGRVMTTQGRDWCEDAIERLATMRKPTAYPITIHYVIREFLRANRDGANLEKVIVDCMKKAGVIEDDDVRRVVGESWRYEPTEGGVGVDVWWEQAMSVQSKPKKKKSN